MLTKGFVEQLVERSNEIDTLDFKRELPNTLEKSKLAELIRDIISIANSAFENGEIRGYLIFGIDDKTREVINIKGKVLRLKTKDKRPRGNPPTQTDVNAHNQRKFKKIVESYISGYNRRKIRINYDAWEHPDEPTSIISVLEIIGQHGPYIVEKEIHILDRDGRTTGQEIAPGQSWIREGEDKRELDGNEIISMRDDARLRQREYRRIEKAAKKIGEIYQNWELEIIAIVEGKPPKTQLIRKPLQTKEEFQSCYFDFNDISSLLDQYGNEWYLNHLIISSPPDSGKSTLLRYLLLLRSEARARGRPIQVKKVPNRPKHEELIKYLEYLLDEKKSERNIQRTFVFDLPELKTSHIALLRMIAETYQNSYIWITCDPKSEDSLFEVISLASEKKPLVLPFPGYLDKMCDRLTKLADFVLSDPEKKKYILARKKLVFRDLVDAFHFPLNQMNSSDRYSIALSQLTLGEQIIIKLIDLIGEMEKSALLLLVSALGAPPDSFDRISGSGLVYSEEKLFQVKVYPVEDLPYQVRQLNTIDMDFLTNALEKHEIDYYGFDTINLSQTLKHLVDFLPPREASFKSDLSDLIYKFNGDIHCANCDAYFPTSLKYCPNCGGKVNFQNREVMKASILDNIVIPYPNSEFLRSGTFKEPRGIDTRKVQQLIQSLPQDEWSI